jgi:hypothetical protein
MVQTHATGNGHSTRSTLPAKRYRAPETATAQASKRKGTRPAARVPEPEPEVEEEEGPQLSRRTSKRIEDIRAPFRTHVTAFGHMDEKAQDLAPDFMRAFNAWKAETDGTFVTFVRMFDEDVPPNRDPDPKDRTNLGYRNHRTYRAADYLRRLVAAPEEGAEGVERGDREGPSSVSEAFVRLLSAIVALIPGNQVDKLWGLIGSELHWSERRVASLREQVQDVEPLVEAHVEQRQVVIEEPQ